ncbi:MAG: hypothetical protein HeimC2_08580 [Candidatus Heimdallarchaeota archaeon LC_2]|nr:MAG: hypothetical protein HeimC2_08580 [Candidatus Heimdallarchaeota archaeon LC_2]
MRRHQIRVKFQTEKVIGKALDDAKSWVNKSSKYSSEQIYKTLLVAGLRKTSLEDQCLHLQERAGGYGSSPSADVVLKVLDQQYGAMDLDTLEQTIAKNLQRMAIMLPQFGKKRQSVIIAVDLHDEEYFGKPLYDRDGREITMYGQLRNKSGNISGNKRRVFRYATAAIVSFGKRLQIPITIGFTINYKGQSRDEVIKKIYQQILPLNLNIECMVVDGGFASIRCFRFLQNQGVSFVSRGNYFKKRIYPVIGQNFEHTLSGYAGKMTVNAFIVETKSATGNRIRLMYLSSEVITPKVLTDSYGKHFRIENTYRHAKVVKIRTSTRKVHLRWVFWGISMLLELLWELIRYLGKSMGVSDYSFRQKLMIEYFKDHLVLLVPRSIYRFE